MSDGTQTSASTHEDDLPDIVDVVMEMGRQAGDAEKAPSPPLPAVSTPRPFSRKASWVRSSGKP